jgi:hypothetical protein
MGGVGFGGRRGGGCGRVALLERGLAGLPQTLLPTCRRPCRLAADLADLLQTCRRPCRLAADLLQTCCRLAADLLQTCCRLAADLADLLQTCYRLAADLADLLQTCRRPCRLAADLPLTLQTCCRPCRLATDLPPTLQTCGRLAADLADLPSTFHRLCRLHCRVSSTRRPSPTLSLSSAPPPKAAPPTPKAAPPYLPKTHPPQKAVDAVLARERAPSACVVAHSYGTAVASRLLRTRPARVAHLALLDPVGRGLGPKWGALAAAARWASGSEESAFGRGGGGPPPRRAAARGALQAPTQPGPLKPPAAPQTRVPPTVPEPRAINPPRRPAPTRSFSRASCPAFCGPFSTTPPRPQTSR